MNIVVKRALAGLVVTASGCATPVEIVDDVFPAEFGDAGPLAGAGGEGGGAAGQGGTGSAPGGGGVASGGSSAGASSAGAGMQAAAGTALPVGAGGSTAGAGGATALGGAAGAVGAAGAAGAAGATASVGTGGTVGTGATVFEPSACDFDDPTGCDALACVAACPTGDGGSCSTRCQTLVTCVTTDAECNITEDDPLCAARINGIATACTQEADAAGGANTTQTTQPAFVARQFVECICSVPRP